MLRLVTPPGAAAAGILTKDSAVVTGIDDTSELVGAVAVSGTGIPSGTFVESIDDAHTLTLTKAATVEGDEPFAVDLTFTLEPVTIGEAREHLRQTDTSEDRLIASLLSAARRACERKSWRCFLQSTWDYTLDQFPRGCGPFGSWPLVRFPRGDEIRIPNPPLVEVVSLNYVDVGGTTIPLGSSLYGVTAGTPGILAPAYSTVWPYTRGQPGDVVIRYVAGYGPTAADVPEDAKVAVLMMLGHLYDHRGDEDAPVPGIVDELLAGVCWGGYG